MEAGHQEEVESEEVEEESEEERVENGLKKEGGTSAREFDVFECPLASSHHPVED